MSIEELRDVLDRLVREERITRAEATRVLERFRDNEITAADLPLPAARSGLSIPTTTSFAEGMLRSASNKAGVTVAAIPERQRERFLISLLTDFDSFVSDLSFARSAGVQTTREWHRRMRNRVARNILENATLGNGGPLTPQQIEALIPSIREQEAYLQRFAQEIAARQAAGRPMSEAQIVQRARMYNGVAQREFYLHKEGQEQREGLVVDYIPQDDDGTCSPCHDAGRGGPYLPGEGPMPGDVCLGRGKCRCRREVRYDMAAYIELTTNERN